MLGNRVQETTTTVGSGNLVLVGASSNHRTFFTAFGLLRHFFYWIVDDTNSAWEYGYGYLSDATTLVREAVLANSSGTSSPLVLSAGTKNVFSSLGDRMAGVPAVYDDPVNGKCITSAHCTWGGVSSGAFSADSIGFKPFKLEFACTATGLRVSVSAGGAAGAKARLGIYDVGADGLPENLLATTGDVDVTTSGVKVVALASNIFLTPGWYYTAFLTNDATVVWHKGITQSMNSATPLGMEGTAHHRWHAFEAIASGWTDLPAVAGSGATTFGNFNVTFPADVAVRIA